MTKVTSGTAKLVVQCYILSNNYETATLKNTIATASMTHRYEPRMPPPENHWAHMDDSIISSLFNCWISVVKYWMNTHRNHKMEYENSFPTNTCPKIQQREMQFGISPLLCTKCFRLKYVNALHVRNISNNIVEKGFFFSKI
jgi:hypothetical protein